MSWAPSVGAFSAELGGYFSAESTASLTLSSPFSESFYSIYSDSDTLKGVISLLAEEPSKLDFTGDRQILTLSSFWRCESGLAATWRF